VLPSSTSTLSSDEEGNYPEGSINYLVERRLSELAEKRSEFTASAKEGEP
jgi:hypothetical protein